MISIERKNEEGNRNGMMGEDVRPSSRPCLFSHRSDFARNDTVKERDAWEKRKAARNGGFMEESCELSVPQHQKV